MIHRLQMLVDRYRYQMKETSALLNRIDECGPAVDELKGKQDTLRIIIDDLEEMIRWVNSQTSI